MAKYAKADRDAKLSENRKALVNAAAREFSEYGFEKANTGRIAEAAGISKGSVFNYYSTKELLFQDVLSMLAEKHSSFLQATVLPGNTPEENLTALFRAHFRYVADHLAGMQLLAETLHGMDVPRRDVLQKVYAPLIVLVARGIIARGMEDGSFAALDVGETCMLVMELLFGASRPVDASGRAAYDADRVAEFALRSIRKKT